MTFPDGGNYYGQWKNNSMDGEGTYKFPNGDMYSGSWLNGLKHGRGKYLFKNNSLLTATGNKAKSSLEHGRTQTALNLQVHSWMVSPAEKASMNYDREQAVWRVHSSL